MLLALSATYATEKSEDIDFTPFEQSTRSLPCILSAYIPFPFPAEINVMSSLPERIERRSLQFE